MWRAQVWESPGLAWVPWGWSARECLAWECLAWECPESVHRQGSACSAWGWLGSALMGWESPASESERPAWEPLASEWALQRVWESSLG